MLNGNNATNLKPLNLYIMYNAKTVNNQTKFVIKNTPYLKYGIIALIIISVVITIGAINGFTMPPN